MNDVIAVHPSVEMYGSDRMFLEAVTAFRGHVMAVLPGEGSLSEALRQRGIPYQVLDFPVLRRVELSSAISVVRYLWRFMLATPRLTRWLRAQSAATLYVSTIVAPIWFLAGGLARRRVHCHVHECEPNMNRLASRLLVGPLRAAHVIIVNSAATREWIAAAAGRRAARRICVVYNGIEVPSSVGCEVVPGRPGAQMVLVGRLSHRKGQDIAIRATGLLVQRGYEVHLTLVGDCFPGYEHVVRELEDLRDELGLSDVVSLAGFQMDPGSLVRSADVVLVPSRGEPFGLVAVEALMQGRPVVASRVGGLSEIIKDGDTGRLVPPGDPRALADAVAEFLDDPATAHSMGQSGCKDAGERFLMETYVKRMREVIDRNPRASGERFTGADKERSVRPPGAP